LRGLIKPGYSQGRQSRIREEIIINQIIYEHGSDKLVHEAAMLSHSLSHARGADRNNLVDHILSILDQAVDRKYAYFDTKAAYRRGGPKGSTREYADIVKAYKVMRKLNVFEKLEQM
jgi:hypothetical protein